MQEALRHAHVDTGEQFPVSGVWPILRGLLNYSSSALAESEGHLYMYMFVSIDRSIQHAVVHLRGHAFILLGRLMATACRELTMHDPGPASVIRSSYAQ